MSHGASSVCVLKCCHINLHDKVTNGFAVYRLCSAVI